MTKRQLTITLLCLLLMVAVLATRNLREDTDDRASGHARSHSHQTNLRNSGESHTGSSPRHLGNPSAGLQMETEPSPVAFYSSKVTANIQAGESLVMGGYRTANGKHEFTMLTPILIKMEDGREMIQLQSKVLSVAPEFARSSGMDSLTTRYPTANQHAEAWSEQDMRDTILDAYSAHGTHLLAAPGITAMVGQPATIEIGGRNGEPSYSVEATVSKTADGGFSIESQVLRTTGNQP